MTEKLQIINPLHYTGWDELLQTYSESSFFHTSAWAKVLHNSYHYKPLYYTVVENGKLSMLLPVMEIKSALTGKRGVSLPFSDSCPVYFPGRNQFREVFAKILRLGRRAGWKFLELRGGGVFLENAVSSRRFYFHTLDLAENEAFIFRRFRSSTRRNIKKAEREGVKAEICSSAESVEEFYRLNCLTRRRHGIPPQPFRFFRQLYREIISRNQGTVVLASYQNRVIAGAMYFFFNGEALYKYGASDERFQHLRANNLVMWKAIQWFIQKGFKRLSFGRTAPHNQGLRWFKNGWATREEIVSYYKYDIKAGAFIMGKDKESETIHKIFSRLPLPILRATGALLYRHAG